VPAATRFAWADGAVRFNQNKGSAICRNRL
jgi:hypothetical protein